MERNGIDNLLANWSTSVDLRLAPSVFYDRLEDEVISQNISKIILTRTFWREGGWLSDHREYLRVQYRDLVFDICGFPLGRSFIVSWWLGVTERRVSHLFFEIPLIGSFIEDKFLTTTYFQVDYQAGFQRQIHNAVLRVIDELREQNGLPPLGADEREPILAEYYE